MWTMQDWRPLTSKVTSDFWIPGKQKELPGSDLLSRRVAPPVSSALRPFTTVFGMGTGGTTALQPPGSTSK
jgi:hypothetical protein